MARENNLTQAERDELVLSCRTIVKFASKKRYSEWGERLSRMDRSDVEQIAWVAVTRAAREFDPSCGVKFTTFATLVIRYEMNAAAKAYKALKRPQGREVNGGDSVAELACRDESPTPFGAELEAERRGEMEQARGNLLRECRAWWTPRQHEVMRLLMAGMRHTEIAERLGLGRSSVESRIDRARVTANQSLVELGREIRRIAEAN
jgi:RNA polymerase sigma factor (sigma-70 family)